MKRTDITDLFPEATKEQIDKLMDINGADITKLRGDMETLRVQLTNANNEIERLKLQPAEPDPGIRDQLNAANAELKSLKEANALRDMREKIAKHTGVPASLLTAETEEACQAQAQAILDYAKPSAYPTVRDGGEVHAQSASATRDQFADWLNESLK